MKTKSIKLVHLGFELGLLMKGINAFLEIVGGISMLFLTPSRLNRFVVYITQRELAEDPYDLVMNYLLRASQSFSVSTQYFGVFYLMSHGLIKAFLIFFLVRKKLWAYPLTIVSLILFIVYQFYRYSFTHSFALILLTIFDLLMIVLTWLEYKNIKAKFAAETQN